MKNDGKVTANVLAYVPETHPIFLLKKDTFYSTRKARDSNPVSEQEEENTKNLD